jgi:antitoxin CptB
MLSQANNDSDRRLVWQCRRGMRELDELLLGFLTRGYAGLDADGRAAFAALLAYPDTVLLELLMGRMSPADKDAADIVRAIRNTAAV